MDEKTGVDLSTVSFDDLAREFKARMKSYESARAELGLGEPGMQRAKYVTKRLGRPPGSTNKGSNTMSVAATKRWAGWKDFSAKNPKATTKDYFKARRAGKA